MKHIVLLLALWVGPGVAMHAQTLSGNQLTWNFDNNNYLKAGFVGQVWLRYTDTNPGSTAFGDPVQGVSDIGLRRWRLTLQGQVAPQVYFFTQFGQNNFTYLSQKYTGSFFHDAVLEFHPHTEALHLGAGLTGFGGPSRFSSPSVASFLGVDAPLYQQTTNGVTDQFLRKLAVYAKGRLHRLEYRIALAKPMAVQVGNEAGAVLSEQHAVFSPRASSLQPQGYLAWQFFESENNTTPYTTGTYLGTKKVMNVGAGAVFQKNAMLELTSGDTSAVNMLQLAVDYFLELPSAKANGSSFNVYAAYHILDFGKNYVRNVGAMNPANGVDGNATLSGVGNAFPMVGTGEIVYVQTGYKLRDGLVGKGTLLPYAAVQYATFDAFDDAVVMLDGGVSYLIYGNHTAKITAALQNRPIIDVRNGKRVEVDRKNMAVVQLQIAL